MILPGDPLPAGRQPCGAAPPVSVEADDLPDEVPRPLPCAVERQRMHPRAQRDDVDTIIAHEGRAHDRLGEVELAHDGPRGTVEHPMPAGCGGDVEVGAGDGRRRDVVDVLWAAPRDVGPERRERGRIERPAAARTVHDEHAALGHHRRGEDRIAEGRGRHQPETLRIDVAVGRVTRVTRVEHELWPRLGCTCDAHAGGAPEGRDREHREPEPRRQERDAGRGDALSRRRDRPHGSDLGGRAGRSVVERRSSNGGRRTAVVAARSWAGDFVPPPLRPRPACRSRIPGIRCARAPPAGGCCGRRRRRRACACPHGSPRSRGTGTRPTP